MMKKEMIWRVGLYAFGMWILAVGAVLGNRTGIGVFAINAIPFAVSEALDISFATMNLLFYCMFIVLQFILRGKEHRRWRDLLQLPASFAFSALLEVVEAPAFVTVYTGAEAVPEITATVEAMLAAKALGAEMMTLDGGQPLYDYVISLE